MYNLTHSAHFPQHSAELLSNKEPLKQFPTARYFQVHFEFLQEQLQLLLRMQEVMRLQINRLEQDLLDRSQLSLNENSMTNVEADQAPSRREPTKNKARH